MKNSKRLAVLLCAAWLVFRITDLALFTDPSTGFVTSGPAWLRWAVALCAAVFISLLSHWVPRDTVPRAGCAQGAALTAAGVFFTLSALAALSAPIHALLTLAAGIWCLFFGIRMLRGGKRVLHAAWCLPVLVPIMAALIWQFSVIPASTARLDCTFRVLGGAAAALFLCVLFKEIFAPGTPCGRDAFRCGMMALLFCTCQETPQALSALLCGRITLSAALFSFGQGALGLCGLAMVYSSGPAQNSDKNT